MHPNHLLFFHFGPLKFVVEQRLMMILGQACRMLMCRRTKVIEIQTPGAWERDRLDSHSRVTM